MSDAPECPHCGGNPSGSATFELSCCPLAYRDVEMRDRIKRAVKVLEGARRYRGDLVEDDHYGAYMQSGTNGGWLDVIEVEQALEILRGNSPESPDSSPVTADDLAVADYYEAAGASAGCVDVATTDAGGVTMGKRKWRSAKTPPDSDRLVRLRINKPGSGDDRLYFIGWYVAELGGYVLTRKNIYDRVFIVPTHWRELE